MLLDMEELAPRRQRSPLPALMLVLPCAVFVIANVLKHSLGVSLMYDALRPVLAPGPQALQVLVDALVVLGPLAALILSATSILRVRMHRAGGALHGSFAVSLQRGHLVVLAVSLTLLATVGGYLVTENLLS